jgi:flagellar biosynthesis/type III secretory pathway protein FliH
MGRLVKGDGGRIVPAAVLTAKEQAAAILAAARAEATRIRSEAESVCEEARRRGRAEAEQGLMELLVGARAEADATRAGARDAAITLASRMAERIVGHAVDLSPATMADIAARALEASRARAGAIKMRVHPQDLAALARERERLVARIASGAELRLVADDTVSRYGCIVETAAGRLDARLETQIAALEKVLLGERPHG